MGIHDDAALRRLAKHLMKAGHRNNSAGDHVAQNLAGSHRRQLVDITDCQECGVPWQGGQEGMHQWHIDHGHLVDDKKGAFEGVVRIAPESAISRINFEETVDGLRLHACCLAHAFGRSPGRSGEQHLHLSDGKDGEDGIDDGRLADTRTAGDDHDFRREGSSHRLLLACRQLNADTPLHPGDRLAGIDCLPWGRMLKEGTKHTCNSRLGAMEAGGKDTVTLPDPIQDNRALRKFKIECLANQRLGSIREAVG